MSKSYGAVAASVAANKAKHPDKYCSSPRCLWRLSSGPCKKHSTPVVAVPECRACGVLIGTGPFHVPEAKGKPGFCLECAQWWDSIPEARPELIDTGSRLPERKL